MVPVSMGFLPIMHSEHRGAYQSPGQSNVKEFTYSCDPEKQDCGIKTPGNQFPSSERKSVR